MPRPSIPQYRPTPGRDCARVTLDGKIYYLGKYGSEASRLKYDQLIAEWIRNGRQMPQDDPDELLVAELCEQYTYHIREYYGDTGKRRGMLSNMRKPLNDLMDLFGDELALSFGPKRLKALQRLWIDRGVSRGHVNTLTGRIKQMFQWAVSEELVPVEVHQALKTVPGIRRGRSQARESKPVKPISDTVVEQTLPHLPRVVSAMVLVQRYTGARPGEVCKMKAEEIDRSDPDEWIYRPEQHKTADKGKVREIPIGPQAQTIIERYWKDAGYLFVPSRKKGPPCGPCYTNDSYRRAIHRACDEHEIERWSPHRLRHTAATEIRNEFGIEHAQAALGHSSPRVTEIYAEHSLTRAKEVATRLG